MTILDLCVTLIFYFDTPLSSSYITGNSSKIWSIFILLHASFNFVISWPWSTDFILKLHPWILNHVFIFVCRFHIQHWLTFSWLTDLPCLSRLKCWYFKYIYCFVCRDVHFCSPWAADFFLIEATVINLDCLSSFESIV